MIRGPIMDMGSNIVKSVISAYFYKKNVMNLSMSYLGNKQSVFIFSMVSGM